MAVQLNPLASRIGRPKRLVLAGLLLFVIGMLQVGFLGVALAIGATNRPELRLGSETYDLVRYGWPFVPLAVGVGELAAAVSALTARRFPVAAIGTMALVAFAAVPVLDGKFGLLLLALAIYGVILSAKSSFRPA